MGDIFQQARSRLSRAARGAESSRRTRNAQENVFRAAAQQTREDLKDPEKGEEALETAMNWGPMGIAGTIERAGAKIVDFATQRLVRRGQEVADRVNKYREVQRQAQIILQREGAKANQNLNDIRGILERYPNLSMETIKELSTPDLTLRLRQMGAGLADNSQYRQQAEHLKNLVSEYTNQIDVITRTSQVIEANRGKLANLENELIAMQQEAAKRSR